MSIVTYVKALRDTVEKRFRPTVLVLSTDGVECTCRKNGINLISLLRPFASLPKDVHTKTTGEPYPLGSFGVRLTDFSGLSSMSEEDKVRWFTKLAKEDLDFRRTVDKKKMQDWESDLGYLAEQSDPSRPDIGPGQMTKIVADLSSPLLQRFKEEYTNSCRFTAFDTFDHPVACILAVSATSPDAIAELKGLFTVHQPAFTNQAVDHNQAMFYVLVQDMSMPCKQSEVDRMFADMKSQFGTQCCRLLQINSNSTGTMQVDPAKWVEPVTIDNQVRTPNEGLMQLLSQEDEMSVAKMMSSFIEMTLLPDLTRRIKTLNQSVADKRQGRIGKMMTYFWQGNKNNDNASKPPKEGPHFGPESCEMQLRKLADLCFLLHDYETALSVYKILRSELGSQESKNKNLHIYHAAVSEGMGMCMAVQQKRDADTQLEQAATSYIKGRRPDYSLRTRLLQYTLSKFSKSYKSADIMKMASTIDERNSLYCGLFIEEAGVSYLYCNYAGLTTTRLRKFAFNLTLAGCRYSTCGCADQALRVTTMAAAVYNRMNLEKWRLINEHVQLTLARLWQQKGELGNAVSHMGKYLVQVQGTSEKMVKEFNGYLQAHLESIEDRVYDELPFPFVDMLGIKLNPTPHAELWQSPTSSVEASVPAGCKLDVAGVHKEWTTMEGDLVNSVRTEFKNLRLHPQLERSRQVRKMKRVDMSQHPDIIVEGEEVFATISMTNPLTLPLVLHEATILYEVTPEKPDQLSSINPPSGKVLKGASVSDVTIAAQSKVPLRLSFTSPTAGWVRLVGVEWAMTTERLVKTSGRYMFYKGAVDNGEVGMTAVKKLTLQCTESAPLMKVEIRDPPPLYMLHGEVTKSVLLLHNKGGREMQQITLKLSRANVHIVCIPLPEGGKKEQYEDAEGVYDTYYLPVTIPPGGVFELPIWVRAESGSNSRSVVSNYVPIVLCYGDNSPDPIRRTSKMVIHTIVQPALSMRALCLPPSSVRPEAESEANFIVSLEIRSLRQRKAGSPDTAIALRQVSALSCDWDVTPLDADAVQMPCTINSGSAFTISFRVKRRTDGQKRAAACFSEPSCSGYKVDNLPFNYFAVNALPDTEIGTGGAGSVGVAVMKSRGGMQMFLDRKEKKNTSGSTIDNTDFPLAFSLFWSAVGEDPCPDLPFTGQAICCCQPCNTTVKASHKWQDSSKGTKNLLRTRGITTTDEVPRPLSSQDQEHNIIGVSLSFPGEARHDFRSNVPCTVSVHITLTNYYSSQREVWVSFLSNKVAYRTQTQQVADTAPASQPLPSLVKGPQQQAQQMKVEIPYIQYPTFHWQGKSKHKVLFGCYESITIVAKAQFLRPGMFNLNQFEIRPNKEDTVVEIQGSKQGIDTTWLVSIVHDEEAQTRDVAPCAVVEEGEVVHADVYNEVDLEVECEGEEGEEEEENVPLGNSRSGSPDARDEEERGKDDSVQEERDEERDTEEQQRTELEEHELKEHEQEGSEPQVQEQEVQIPSTHAEEAEEEEENQSPEPAEFDEPGSADRSPSPPLDD